MASKLDNKVLEEYMQKGIVMNNWENLLNGILKFRGRKVLEGKGRVAHEEIEKEL